MNPIYTAPLQARLEDLKTACQTAIYCLEAGQFREAAEQDIKRETLHDFEFAIGNWIVRPRFNQRKDQNHV